MKITRPHGPGPRCGLARASKRHLFFQIYGGPLRPSPFRPEEGTPSDSRGPFWVHICSLPTGVVDLACYRVSLAIGDVHSSNIWSRIRCYSFLAPHESEARNATQIFCSKQALCRPSWSPMLPVNLTGAHGPRSCTRREHLWLLLPM